MNQSEIAERAAREIRHLVICEDCKTRGIPGTKKFNWPLCDWCIREVDEIQPVIEYVCKFVERAIAESQAPKPERKSCKCGGEHLDLEGCCTKCGLPFWAELGDGEPSSAPPDKLKSIKRWIDAAFDVQDFFVRRSDGEIVSLAEIVNEADRISEIRRSGAAQEVSPPSPDANPVKLPCGCEYFCKGHMGQQVGGDTRKRRIFGSNRKVDCRGRASVR